MRTWKEPTGKLPYKARGLDAAGKKVQRSFATRSQREDFVRKFEDDKARVRAGLPVQRENITLRQLYELFLENTPEKASDVWFARMLKRPLEQFGNEYVRSLRPEVFGRWLHALPLSAKTKTHILSCTRKVTRAGAEWDYTPRDPLAAVRGPGVKRLRPIRPFEDWSEVEAVAAELPKHADFVKFVCLTGAMVPSEAFALCWNHYSADSGTLHIPGTKTENRDRTIPLSLPARRILEDQVRPLRNTQPIFAFDYHAFRKTHWPDALDAAGLERRTPNEMRHTFATLALQHGVPIETVSKLLGHADITITLRYYAKFTRRKLESDVAILDNIAEPSGHATDTQDAESS